MKSEKIPNLPFESWIETRITIHIILQIIGKTRLASSPRKNHWWNITLYVSPKGFSTFNIPVNEGVGGVEIELNIPRRAVIISQSAGAEIVISLAQNPTIADFYKEYTSKLMGTGLSIDFVEKPFDVNIEKPFNSITEYHHFDWNYIENFWKIMQWNNSIFQEFSGRFYRKSCPVHIYWHHLDLVVTRFSGKKLPPMDASARVLEKDTYSHEQISFGFWVGDKNMPEPMYYTYTYPSPKGIDNETLQPEGAKWQDSNGSPMALLSYETVKCSSNPRKAVLDFLESAYQAGAKCANWDIEELRVPDLDKL
ncbi:DUF5996 family protein [Aequorivita sp. CIP111184]|uniref:DUF5996 family protein n=1 Tax=Aequorivita sp. CIP111184 TaxID=2211356 RepID=UPI000DBC1B6C|nr:DUF5996 family protein [Aequorivita sp. CIP111184]SRX54439.1 hypothetical protein AEQU1_01449 [Aequorivita sp. CIP111184]